MQGRPGSVQPTRWDRAHPSQTRAWEATEDLSFTQPLYTAAAAISCLHQISVIVMSSYVIIYIAFQLRRIPLRPEAGIVMRTLYFTPKYLVAKELNVIFFILWTNFSKRYLNLFLLVSSTNLMYEKNVIEVNKIWVLLHKI